MEEKFPDAKQIKLKEDFEAKYASAYPNCPYKIVKAAGFIHTKSTFRHGLIILGD
jgi:hypothetical protein